MENETFEPEKALESGNEEKLLEPTVKVIPQKSPILIMTSIFLLLISFSTAGYLYYQNMRLGSQLTSLNSTPTPSPSDKLVPPSDPTTDWKVYTNPALGFEIKYPPNVEIKKVENTPQNRYVRFEGEDLSFEVMLRSGYGIDLAKYYYMDSPIEHKTKLANVDANVYRFPKGYCDGPNCSDPFISVVTVNGPDLYHVTFSGDSELSNIENQILSTFKFISPVDNTSNSNNAKTLSYKLPTGWQVVQDNKSVLEVGYDPSKYNVSTEDNYITFNYRNSPGSFSFLIVPYDGSSRHTFIYKQQGYSSTSTDNRMSGYHEQEYSYNGWNCLILYKLSFSASGTTWGVCPVSSSQAIYFSGPEDQKEMESILSTLKLVK